MSQETKFIKVEFKNFQSFGNQLTTIDLSNRGTTLLVGENLDDGGSSGAGKTTAMSVVAYCLYDKIPTNISKDRMINLTNGKKNTSMEAILTFSKDGHEYIIKRSRGQVTSVQLFEDGNDITPASVTEVNNKVEELIGFSYNLFSQIVLFNGNSKPFLELSIGDQRELIEELFKITLLTRKAKALKKDSSETSKQIDMKKVLIAQQEKQNTAHEARVVDAQNRVHGWYGEKAVAIEKLRQQFQELNEFDFDSEETFHNEIVRLERLKTELSSELTVLNGALNQKLKEKVDGQSDLILLKSKLSAKKLERPDQGKKQEIERELEKLSTEHKKLLGELTHLEDAKCPYCMQDYAASKQKMSEIEDRILTIKYDAVEFNNYLGIENDRVEGEKQRIAEEAVEIEKQIAEVTSLVEAEMLKHAVELQELKEGVSSKKAEVDAVIEEQSTVKAVVTYKTLNEALAAKQSVATIEKQIEIREAEVNPHLDACDALVAEGLIKIDYEGLDSLVYLEAHQKFLVKLLTDKNSFVRKNLIATTTPFLNKRIGYYLERLNLPHVVLFQPDLSCQITQLGRELDHGNLSNGEKKRLNLALCLSFRDVLTYLHSKVNVLFTDEVDGGSLDSPCVDLLIQLLKKKAWDDNISIFIISHRPEFEGRCDRNYVIRKEQGFSSLIIQPDG